MRSRSITSRRAVYSTNALSLTLSFPSLIHNAAAAAVATFGEIKVETVLGRQVPSREGRTSPISSTQQHTQGERGHNTAQHEGLHLAAATNAHSPILIALPLLMWQHYHPSALCAPLASPRRWNSIHLHSVLCEN
ncbi:hypothetical protein DQ04_09361000 [Trypanosoma grayi]|uniref:hypothetical protein n=1 Tax=Trypanosoma grayi TaxID=71804 RepID=UPI0004F47041|nr:hypothetical protein DQ04_09361000 [Trypanosoma grayi]KEG07581.1 hypothetical protein DQ04_09361000 [Trypanosoma grayi]